MRALLELYPLTPPRIVCPYAPLGGTRDPKSRITEHRRFGGASLTVLRSGMAEETGSPEQTLDRWAEERAEALALTPDQLKVLIEILGSTTVPARNFCEAGKAENALPLLRKLDTLMTVLRWKRKRPGGDPGR